MRKKKRMTTFINEEKRQTLRKMLEDMGYMSSDTRTYSPHEIADIFSTISATTEFKALMKKENIAKRVKCGREMCYQYMMCYGVKDDTIRFCSDSCRAEYIHTVTLVYTSQEIEALQLAFVKADADGILKILKNKVDNSKVYGLVGYLCKSAGTNYTTFKDLGCGTSFKKVLAMMKAAGITLKVK